MNLQDISLGRHAPSIVNVVIETPKGSKKKFRYHTKSRSFRLAYEFSIPVPTEYGWIPETIAEDGHFLNAMVIAQDSTHPGYICEARPIGVLKRKDNDHHVICVSLSDERYVSVKDIFDLDVKLLKQIVRFFEPYFELTGWLDYTEAIEVIKAAHEKHIAKRNARMVEGRGKQMPKADEIVDVVAGVENEEASESSDELFGSGEEEEGNAGSNN